MSQLETDFAAEEARGEDRFESPVVLSNVGKIPCFEATGRSINAKPGLPFEIPVLPAKHEWNQLDVAETISGVLNFRAETGKPGIERQITFYLQPEVGHHHRGAVLAANNFHGVCKRNKEVSA